MVKSGMDPVRFVKHNGKARYGSCMVCEDIMVKPGMDPVWFMRTQW